jgi:HSP20 family protein
MSATGPVGREPSRHWCGTAPVTRLGAPTREEERLVPAARSRTRKKKTAAKKAAAPTKATKTTKAAARPAEKPRAEVAVEAVPPERSLEARLLAPLEEMERMLDAFRRGDWFRPLTFDWPRWPELPFEGRFPSIDVVNRDKEIQIKAEVPGMEKQDISVTVTDRTLTIKGESRREEESEEGELHRREIRTGSFSRTLTLPEDVDGSKAKASYKDGLLELRLPKLRRAKRHAIDVE